MIGVAVIGYGYWGPNVARNFSMVDDARLVAICDPNTERLALAAKLYPAVRLYHDVTDLLSDPDIDGVAIATPVHTHFDIALRALRAGKHVLVEKPMTSTVAEAEALVDEAERAGLVLMVDHTFIYTSAVRKIHELVRSGALGHLYYYDGVRINLGLFQSDVSVLWDLGVHDLSIMDFIVGRSPVAVSATGMRHIRGAPENMAYVTCLFDDDLIAHFHVNWLAPVKVRQTLISGSERMIVYDDIEMSEKIKVYDKGLILADEGEQMYQRHVGYRTGDMWAPRIDNVEALLVEAQHFVECILKNEVPQSDGHAGLRVVRVLEAASASMAQGGVPVLLGQPTSRSR